jgi:hypothetical protein
MICVMLKGISSALTTTGGSALLQKLRKMPRKLKNRRNSVNQGDHDEIKRKSNKYKNRNENM